MNQDDKMAYSVVKYHKFPAVAMLFGWRWVCFPMENCGIFCCHGLVGWRKKWHNPHTLPQNHDNLRVSHPQMPTFKPICWSWTYGMVKKPYLRPLKTLFSARWAQQKQTYSYGEITPLLGDDFITPVEPIDFLPFKTGPLIQLDIFPITSSYNSQR